jgi:Protein of unknown function (DUF2800)
VITASSIARLRNCPSSAVMARAENHNEWADKGHEEHEELARLGDLPINLAELLPPNARAEVKLGYDVASRVGRIIGEGSDRDYGTPGAFEIVGSCDVLGVDGDQVVVLDWKTGFNDVEPAASNGQLHFYALAAVRALGKTSARISIVYTKTGRVDSHELDALDLAEFAGELERLHVTVASRQAAKQRGEILDTKEGSWCRHCASKHVCASKNALLVQVATGGLAVVGDAELTPQRATAAYEQIVRVEQLVKDARKRLETYVDERGPIDLGNGRSYGRYSRPGNESLDGAVAVQAIREVVGESAKEFESIAIEHKTTKAAIARAAKAVATKGHAKVAEAVVQRIRDLGGSKREESYPIGEYVRERNEPATRPEVDIGAVNQLMQAAD